MGAAVAGTTFRPTPTYTTLRDVTSAGAPTAVDVFLVSLRASMGEGTDVCDVAGLLRGFSPMP
jgi:hypothetical protein